jgi:hypothetical protein
MDTRQGMAMSAHWFYSPDGSRQVGPVTKDEIEGLLTRGELGDDALVWTEAMTEWRRAADVAELHWARPAKPPPLPTTTPAAASPPQPPPLGGCEALARVEIHPPRRRNAVLLAGAALFMGGGGIALLASAGDDMDALAGVLCLVIGVLAIYKARAMWGRQTSMVLTPEQLEQITIDGAATLPWTDVEAVGAVSQLGLKLIGLRLRSYDNYLATMSPELARWLTKTLPLMRVAAAGTSMLPGSQLLSLWSRLDGVGDPGEALKSFGKVGDLAGLLMASRKMLGYDLTFSWADFDRPVDELVQLIERYRAAAAVASSPPAPPGA